MSDAKEEKDYSYFHERLDPLGWTPEAGNFTTPTWWFQKGKWELVPKDNMHYREHTYPVFDVDAEGNILIPYYHINGAPATYKKGDGPARHYVTTRLRNPEVDKDGNEVKYRIPKGAGTFAWFPPQLIEAYREAREIDALVLTEGVFKAFAATNAGSYVVGLTSITHGKDRERHLDQLHQDIIDLIRRCRPKKVIYLVDGDCRSFSRKWKPDSDKEKEKDLDLYVKPNGFYSTVRTMRDLLQDLSNELGFSTWWKHVESNCLAGEQEHRTTPPKGLDDLLLENQKVWIANEPPERHAALRAEANAAVVKELHATSGPSHYFYRKSLDRLGEIKKYFAIGSAAEFYAEYGERMIKERPFVFNGTKYKYNGKELEVLLSRELRNYVRVGDTYFERVPVPNRFGKVEEKLHQRLKSTIRDDHGDKVNQIQKLKAFCNVPSHEDYQPIINNCLNRYMPFEHKPEKGEFPHIEKFLKHIFGTNMVVKPHPKRKGEDGKPVMMEVNELDMGYDYIQLLYRAPTQILPILCLVSKSNETGKSTFAKFLKAIFTGNCAFVSSQDLENQFNEHWITKLLAICEEAFLDQKKSTIERIKDLSTASVSMVNTKGVQQVEQEVFLKFILNSNNTRNFINAGKEDIRFWVRDIPPIPESEKNQDLEKLMVEEIPAFLYFLTQRTMATERLSRMWFHPSLLETDALNVVRESSKSTAHKTLESWFRAMFLARRNDEVLLMTAEDVKNEVFQGTKTDVEYVRYIIKEYIGAETVRNKKGDGPGTCAYTYYRMVMKKDPLTGQFEQEVEAVRVKQPARPYVFRRDMFYDDITWEMLKPDEDVKAGNEVSALVNSDKEVEPEDLPF